jgi:SAM-dependent methyltransferase
MMIIIFSIANPLTRTSSDRYTDALLRRLNPTGTPTFRAPLRPPASVLDLGCGQGRWVIDAATVWKEHGTKLIGFDLVDLSSDFLKREKLSPENVEFVRGNLCVLFHFKASRIAPTISMSVSNTSCHSRTIRSTSLGWLTFLSAFLMTDGNSFWNKSAEFLRPVDVSSSSTTKFYSRTTTPLCHHRLLASRLL